jgi:hypothetical protein
VSADPIGIEGGINLYAYCNSSPVTTRDLNGTDPKGAPTTKPEPTPPDKRIVTPENLHESRDFGNAQTLVPPTRKSEGFFSRLIKKAQAKGRALIGAGKLLTGEADEVAENVEQAATEITSKPKPASEGGSPPEPTGKRIVTVNDLHANRNLGKAQQIDKRLVSLNDLHAHRNLGNAQVAPKAKPDGGGGGGNRKFGPVERAPSLRGRVLLNGLRVAGEAYTVAVFTADVIAQSRDPELREFSLSVGERVEEFTGSDILGALAATKVHVDASVCLAAKKAVEETVIQPVKNTVNAYVDSPGKTIAKHALLWPVGLIGTMTGWF